VAARGLGNNGKSLIDFGFWLCARSWRFPGSQNDNFSLRHCDNFSDIFHSRQKAKKEKKKNINKIINLDFFLPNDTQNSSEEVFK
jgi:hypothetical protein